MSIRDKCASCNKFIWSCECYQQETTAPKDTEIAVLKRMLEIACNESGYVEFTYGELKQQATAELKAEKGEKNEK